MTTPLFAITLLPIFCKEKREQGKDKTLIFTPLDCLFNDFISKWRAPAIVAFWIGDMIFAFSHPFISMSETVYGYKYSWSTVRYFWSTKIVVFYEKRIALNRIESPRIFLPFFKIPPLSIPKLQTYPSIKNVDEANKNCALSNKFRMQARLLLQADFDVVVCYLL